MAPEPIAIIGIGCRFPGGANTPSKLWELLESPRSVASLIPKDRWNVDKFYHPVGSHHGTTNVRESYFLDDDIKRFDAPFFSIGPAEAEAMDPQHRILLEVVFEALENGGIQLERLQGSDTAVYVGMMCTDYSASLLLDSNVIPTYAATGVASSNASSRISYHYNWHGPSMTIDTACSSSLVAIHHAIDQLRLGRSRVAVAAGTNLLLTPLSYISESNLSMLSPTGRSRMWDADADGYARGDGVSAVILKTLAHAIQDGDEIQAIVRHTAFSHDGKTKGITMPSGDAQAALIRQTYKEAGLDILSKTDRPQFFEAHGTGTPVGDPQEASALAGAFFPDGYDSEEDMFVGSIKTIVGHTEGTAGIAGIIKACLALKHARIPPNLLFSQLSPGVAPFANNLTIPTKALAWPAISHGQPRRASVNSFGFGGTDAHAIMESYQSGPQTLPSEERGMPGAPLALPFTFSASSEVSLVSLLSNFDSYISEFGATIDLGDLAYTLTCRRAALPYKVAFAASTADELQRAIQKKLETAENKGTRTSCELSTTYLGVFTGQGAQWAGMGKGLVETSPVASSRISELEASLAALPPCDRPSWSLREEISAAADKSRLSNAEISQPLCTALQIVLVDFLRLAGIEFSAVCGHSSGEMAAAYAAGFLSATDALRIAYYRGRCSSLYGGQSETGERGAMLAVSTTLEDAQELCEADDFTGRLTIAAINSPTSLTLSGDHSAITEAKEVFDAEGKFCRVLRVDKAYHSHHMLPAAEPYKKALAACKIEVLRPDSAAAKWYSSVDNGTIMQYEAPGMIERLAGEYWATNMTGAVLFQEALVKASCSPPDVVIEVGPHPALKGPAMDVLKASSISISGYFGTCQRGKHDVLAMASTLGGLWSLRGSMPLRLDNYQRAFAGRPARFISNLPSYPWDHTKSFWSEARTTKNYFREDSIIHSLLGQKLPDGNDEDWRWTNLLKIDELPWLAGHALQGQVVFPFTGYLALAIEASMQVAAAGGTNAAVQCIEVTEFEVRKAIAIPPTGSEIVVSLTAVKRTRIDGAGSNGKITTRFSCSAPPSKDATQVSTNCVGHVVITLASEGESNPNALAPRLASPTGLRSISVDEFYDETAKLGYGYEGEFRAITRLERKLNVSSGAVTTTPAGPGETPLLLHPAMLDSALQGLFAAYCHPGDDRLRVLHAPTFVKKVSVQPRLCQERLGGTVEFDGFCTDTTQRGFIVGDLDIYDAGFEHKLVDFEGVTLRALSPWTKANDKYLFAGSAWYLAQVNGELAAKGLVEPLNTLEGRAIDLERIAFYFLMKTRDTLRAEAGRRELPSHRHAALRWADHVYEHVSASKPHPVLRKEWLDDTQQAIYDLMGRYPTDADVALARAVGENLPSVIEQDGNIFEFMLAGGVLDRFYEDGLGFKSVNSLSAAVMKQISERYPQTNIIEIGAGTCGTTKGIVAALDKAFASYTVTDISPGFFEKAKQVFSYTADRMEYKVLDVESPPVDQGFERSCYDVAVAAHVLHATKDLKTTLSHVRSLLKPGGLLVAVEIVDPTSIRAGVYYCGTPGWWIGSDTGRPWSPNVSLSEWDTLLRRSGFAGVETSTPLGNSIVNPATVYVAQALDDDFRLLREPLAAHLPGAVMGKSLVIVGGTPGSHASTLAGAVQKLLSSRYETVQSVESVEQLLYSELPSNCTTLSLGDLDAPFFKFVTDRGWEGAKKLLAGSSVALWLTTGASDGTEPYSAMIAGWFRSIRYEIPDCQFQTLDVNSSRASLASVVAESLLRLETQVQWKNESPSSSSKRHSPMMWSLESELAWDGQNMHVLRIKPDSQRNDRYNALNRRMTKLLDTSDPAHSNAVVELEFDRQLGSTSWVTKASPSDLSDVDIVIDAAYSVLSSIQTPGGRLFLVLGREAGSKDNFHLCLTTSQASRFTIPRSHAIAVSPEAGIAIPYLSFATAYLICRQLVSIIPAKSIAVVHEADPVLAGILAKDLSDKGTLVIFTTTNAELRTKPGWVFLHPAAPQRAIDAAVPRNVSVFIDTTLNGRNSSSSGARFSARLQSSLSPLTTRYDAASFLASEARPTLGIDPSAVTSLLHGADDFSTDLLYEITESMPLDVSSVADIVSEPSRFANELDLRIVSWTGGAPVEVRPADCRKDLFRPDATYWLVGLAGDMGRSFCDWMTEHGARYIVLSSRAPQLPVEWLDEHIAKGNNIAAVQLDVTTFESVQRAKNDILNTLKFPPIKGVANGAMVIRDARMVDTDFNTLQEVLRPKVEGTIHLDKAFSSTESSESLDWFTVLSSFICCSGNFGQFAYSSANAFQKSLVRQRRQRGLPGTSIDISSVVGVGYVTREKGQGGKLNKHHAERLSSKHTLVNPISEVDLHQMFAEAVMADSSTARCDPEIITGPQPVTREQTEETMAAWTANPRFSHWVWSSKDRGIVAATETNKIPLKERLAEAKSSDEATSILKDAFLQKLQSGLSTDKLDETIPLVDLGVDSLVAVVIRDWAQAEVGVKLPVLKILGGASTVDLIDFLIQNMPHSDSSGPDDVNNNDLPSKSDDDVSSAGEHDGSSAMDDSTCTDISVISASEAVEK